MARKSKKEIAKRINKKTDKIQKIKRERDNLVKKIE